MAIKIIWINDLVFKSDLRRSKVQLLSAKVHFELMMTYTRGLDLIYEEISLYKYILTYIREVFLQVYLNKFILSFSASTYLSV